jgi:hypothetical protein
MRSVVEALPELPPSYGFTYSELAERAYATADPTRAQLSAVRRAVAALERDGVVRKDWNHDHVLVMPLRPPSYASEDVAHRLLFVLRSTSPRRAARVRDLPRWIYGVGPPTAAERAQLQGAIQRLEDRGILTRGTFEGGEEGICFAEEL